MGIPDIGKVKFSGVPLFGVVMFSVLLIFICPLFYLVPLPATPILIPAINLKASVGAGRNQKLCYQ